MKEETDKDTLLICFIGVIMLHLIDTVAFCAVGGFIELLALIFRG